MNQKDFANITKIIVVVVIVGIAGYFIINQQRHFLEKNQVTCIPEGGLNYENIYSETPINERLKCCSGLVPQENLGIADAPAVCVKSTSVIPIQVVENNKSAPRQQTTVKVQVVPIETLNQKVKITWNTQPPQNFNPKTALEQIQNFVYAFPGYQYQTLRVEMTDTKTSFTRNSQEREQAKEQGDFIFDIVIHGSLNNVNEEGLRGINESDTYFFNFSFSEKNGTYTLTNKEFTLYALSPETISKAKKIAGVSENLSSVFNVTTGWLKTTSGNFWYSGVKDGIVHINVLELDGSGPELGSKSSKTYYVDIFEERVIKVAQ